MDEDFITQTPSPKGKLMQSVSSMLWFSERVNIHQPQGRQGQQYDETMRCPWRRHCSLRPEAVKKVASWGKKIGLMEVKATPPTPQQSPPPLAKPCQEPKIYRDGNIMLTTQEATEG